MMNFFSRIVAGRPQVDQAENRRVMALNVAVQIHQVALGSGQLTVERLIETARQIELYVMSGALPAKTGVVTSIYMTAPSERPVA